MALTSAKSEHKCAAVQILEGLGIVTELTGQKKNRSYSYQPYIDLLAQ